MWVRQAPHFRRHGTSLGRDPFPPGHAYDSLGRPWAERIKPLLGSIVVENIGGAGASLGASTVAKANRRFYVSTLTPPSAVTRPCFSITICVAS